jgi:transcriptional regulator with XRE-family HTH domain
MGDAGDLHDIGDLGRRLSERRKALGLTEDEVASRAGIHPTYVRFLETSPTSQPSRATLLRLASALDTTIETISGGGTQLPPGRTGPSSSPALEALGVDECRRLIAPGGVGRIVFVEPRGPVALPVNFKTMDGDIVFRTAPTPTLSAALGNGDISFEVDHLDDALAEGWSVLISGAAHVIEDPADLERAKALHVEPWAGGERDLLVRINPDEVTGRRIRRR